MRVAVVRHTGECLTLAESSRILRGDMAIIELLLKYLGAVIKGFPGFQSDRRRKEILRAMLEQSRYEWRSIDVLARAIGDTKQERTRELLISIGARASTGSGRESWALADRVGLSGVQGAAEDIDA